MNKELEDKIYAVPENILEHLRNVVNDDQYFDGTFRAKKILETKKVTYHQLKRILHDMKYVDKVKDKKKYDLWGGEVMERWGWEILKSDRKNIESQKTGRKRFDDIGGIDRKNNFLKKHKKKKSFVSSHTPLKTNGSYIDPIMSLGVFEEIKRIKQLMK